MRSPLTPHRVQIANGLLLAVIVLLISISGASLASYFSHPEEYRFGTEVGGILYRSSTHYWSILLGELTFLSLGLVLSFFIRKPVHKLWGRFSLVLADGILLFSLLPG
ncbi:hypothetical protein SAMN05444354_107178 [Stigmatella aurantiaca]|uniref:Uncharacterized protein n=1 Tax=Stigmatella aurantiaca TaxID=41 RepID=A0A1H7RTF8_STIAU|nr:hypothetical protein [Stigmatella aurantiaca]SEL63531.1 hypothetical protein SAMN05444354_107178 [Stigmatella aurantiaca]